MNNISDLNNIFPAGKSFITSSIESKRAALSLGKVMYNDTTYFSPIFWFIHSKLHLEMMRRFDEFSRSTGRALHYNSLNFSAITGAWFLGLHNLTLKDESVQKRLNERCANVNKWIEIFRQLSSIVY